MTHMRIKRHSYLLRVTSNTV